MSIKSKLREKYPNLPEKYNHWKLFLTQYLIHIFGIIYFNFRYLPFKQAVRLPVWIIWRHPGRFRGKVVIDAPKIKSGMIQIGHRVCLYYKKGISFSSKGGTVIFKGTCLIGNECIIDLWEKGVLIFGDNFGASASMFLCQRHMEFKENVDVGFGCVIMDTDFHAIKYRGKKLPVTGKVIIGSNTWIGAKTVIRKNTQTPDYCIIGGSSTLAKYYNCPGHCIISGSPAEFVAGNFTWDKSDDLPIDVY